MKKWLYSLLAILFFAFGQNELAAQVGPADSPAEYQKIYEDRIKKERLNRVYIPKDLGDAFAQLNRLTSEEDRAKFKSLPEDLAKERLFYGFGRWMILNWSFYDGSRFSHYLKQIGITHPEDMAEFVMVTYHRNLNRNELNVKALVKGFKAKRKALASEKLEQGTIIHEETRTRPRTTSPEGQTTKGQKGNEGSGGR